MISASISFVLFKVGGLLFLMANLSRTLSDPIERRAFKSVELLKLQKNQGAISGSKTTRLLLDVQAILISSYGRPLSLVALVKTFFHSLAFCIGFSLFLGVYLFESLYGPIRMLSWPNLLSYFVWTSIVVSVVAVLDVTFARLVLNLLIASQEVFKKWIFFVVLLAVPIFFFVVATALVSGTSVNSIALVRGSLDGYWSADFILDRFTLLVKNPLAEIGNVQITSIQRPVRTQAVTWFAGIGSLTILVFALLSVLSTRIATAQSSFRFLKLGLVRKVTPPKLLWIYLTSFSAVFFLMGLFFAINGL